MNYVRLLSLTVAVGVLAVSGCKKDLNSQESTDTSDTPATTTVTRSTDPNEVVATVNDKKYIRKEMDKTVNALLTAQKVPTEQIEEARKFFEQRAVYSFVMKTILLDEVKKESITLTDEDRKEKLEKIAEALKAQNKSVDEYFKESPLGEDAARAEFEDGMLIDKLVTINVLNKIEISDADIETSINEIKTHNAAIEEKNKNLGDPKAQAKTKIDEIKKQLDGGADFAELAKENSDCPSGQKGGDLGEFTRGNMVKPFEDAAFSQEIGKVGDIVETQFGYHLIKVTGKTPAVEAKGDDPAKPEAVTASHILVKIEQPEQPQPLPSPEDVKEQLKQNKSREAVQSYIAELKNKAKIETIFPDLDI